MSRTTSGNAGVAHKREVAEISIVRNASLGLNELCDEAGEVIAREWSHHMFGWRVPHAPELQHVRFTSLKITALF